jgi:hypothetical protein
MKASMLIVLMSIIEAFLVFSNIIDIQNSICHFGMSF